MNNNNTATETVKFTETTFEVVCAGAVVWSLVLSAENAASGRKYNRAHDLAAFEARVARGTVRVRVA